MRSSRRLTLRLSQNVIGSVGVFETTLGGLQCRIPYPYLPPLFRFAVLAQTPQKNTSPNYAGYEGKAEPMLASVNGRFPDRVSVRLSHGAKSVDGRWQVKFRVLKKFSRAVFFEPVIRS